MQKGPSPRGTGPSVVINCAQALGLRPWLAALPLRERRLRARLLIVCSSLLGVVVRSVRLCPEMGSHLR